ncbi:MAG: maltose alpha-D-glucosyltransferase [Candidatus Atribacteria bacterium]|nr:maltose alpha-D-glucosyltransferase [Candidatus Atribacteria bacterium]
MFSQKKFSENPLWYKDAIIYELHVKTFYDKDGDGVGDFKGLIEKLDYLESLGINTIWLLPFFPSPLKDDGYDIADYTSIHPLYGTMAQFKKFLKEAHRRELKVVIELVLNHTSDQHQWFQRARKKDAPKRWRDFYVWSETPDKYLDTRIIFQDFETSNWTRDPENGLYFWHRFYSHQPDLNYDNPEVQEAILKVLDFWFEMGVDGVRLDAVPYLFEREGTNCENLPESLDFLKKMRAHVDKKYANRMILAEANQWPEDTVLYFGDGDACHMAFHFPLMPRMFMAFRMEDRFPIIDILEQTPPIPDNCQWALFLRNHDELTLEMVTDEERDYMYRVYAKDKTARINLGIRRRLAPLMENHRRKIEIMNILLFSLPGTPTLYYGDEIGMGDNHFLGDRDGVRTPMQWSPDRNAGFSRANPQQLYLPTIIDPAYHYETVNVETQEQNQTSLLWWMKRVINMRKNYKAFSRGTLEFLHSDNSKVLVFLRKYEQETILVVVNLSRFSQVVEINLASYAGYTPVELFSKNPFPTIQEKPYIMTLGFYDYFWFILQKEEDVSSTKTVREIPMIKSDVDWTQLFNTKGQLRKRMENEVFPQFLKEQRWFGSKSQRILKISISEVLTLPQKNSVNILLLLKVNYSAASEEIYSIPLSFASIEYAHELLIEKPQSILLQYQSDTQEGFIYDATLDESFHQTLLQLIAHRHIVGGVEGKLKAYPGKYFKGLTKLINRVEQSHLLTTEQSNSSILYDRTLILKLFRKLDEGINPDLELTKYLSKKTYFQNTPSFAGALEYWKKDGSQITLGMLSPFIPNEGSAWELAQDYLVRYYEKVLSQPSQPSLPDSFFPNIEQDIPEEIQELIEVPFIEMVSLLGKRTAELHNTLGSSTQDREFKPESFSTLYQRSVFQSLQSLVKRVFLSLKKNYKLYPETIQEDLQKVLSLESQIITYSRQITTQKLDAKKIRIHGDYHLGQVLYTGNDFYIIDFEGEPARPLGVRRLKHCPLKDVAGMLRSFYYAAFTPPLQKKITGGDYDKLEQWAKLWIFYISKVFLNAYFEHIQQTLIPKNQLEISQLLNIYLLEKVTYEIRYEMDNRPDWLAIPLKGLLFEVKKINSEKEE